MWRILGALDQNMKLAHLQSEVLNNAALFTHRKFRAMSQMFLKHGEICRIILFGDVSYHASVLFSPKDLNCTISEVPTSAITTKRI